MKSTLSGAFEGLSACEDALYDIDAAGGDCMDCIDALQQLTAPQSTTARLSELLVAAQDLSRPSTRLVGDAPLPDLSFDPEIGVPRALAVALLATGYRDLADELARAGHCRGISTAIHDRRDAVAVAITAPGLDGAFVQRTAGGLREQIGDDPGVALGHSGASLELIFEILPREA